MTPIDQKYADLGGPAGWLGQPTSPENCGLREGGCFREFAGGAIYYSPATGASAVRGAIRAHWSALGWETGRLGYPVSDEFCGLKDGGCAQRFQGGLVYWSPGSGVAAVWGAIGERYAGLRWETSKLGYPVQDEFCGLKDGGCAQRFQGGMVYWTPGTGAHPVWGAIVDRYRTVGWETSKLGYPVEGEFCGLRDGGCAQRFQGGMVYWSPNSGAQPVWGAILQRYASVRWETSTLGYPVGGEFCGLRDGGCGQHFQGGSIYWSPGSGANPVWGRIRDAYAAQGWEAGGLRYPTTGEGPVVNAMITQEFQGGKLVYHTDTYAVDSGATPGLVTGGYPDADAAPCGGSWCKNGSSMSARGFAYRNCTDFAAWRRGMVWGQINGSGDGNAIGWRQGWMQRGRAVGSTPRVGAVAWWGASHGGGYGHVAIVIGVNPDGSARVEHYNYEVRGGYSITESVRAEAYLY